MNRNIESDVNTERTREIKINTDILSCLTIDNWRERLQSIIIAGITESGKTNLLKHIIQLNFRGNFDTLRIVCPTIDIQAAYQGWIPNQLVISGNSDQVEQQVTDLVNKQKKIGRAHV